MAIYSVLHITALMQSYSVLCSTKSRQNLCNVAIALMLVIQKMLLCDELEWVETTPFFTWIGFGIFLLKAMVIPLL